MFHIQAHVHSVLLRPTVLHPSPFITSTRHGSIVVDISITASGGRPFDDHVGIIESDPKRCAVKLYMGETCVHMYVLYRTESGKPENEWGKHHYGASFKGDLLLAALDKTKHAPTLINVCQQEDEWALFAVQSKHMSVVTKSTIKLFTAIFFMEILSDNVMGRRIHGTYRDRTIFNNLIENQMLSGSSWGKPVHGK